MCDLFEVLVAAVFCWAAGWVAWRLMLDRRAARIARLRHSLIAAKKEKPFRLPPAEETRLIVARFRRAAARWLRPPPP